MRNKMLRIICVMACLYASCFAILAAEKNPAAVVGLLNRIGGEGTADRLVTVCDESLSADGSEVFVIGSESGKPCIKGSTLSALTVGINWYLNHYAHVNLSWNRLTADMKRCKFPVPEKEERHQSNADYRYYLNYCTFSYSMSVWTWERWQQEIDWMALHGINLPLQIVGLDAVWYELLTEDYGYSHEEANQFIAGPCFQAWWGMNNMEGWGGPNPVWWYKRQAGLAKKICDRMRELGMQPVLPGYSGMVPSNLTEKTGMQANNQGKWCAFVRPYILDPNSEAFGKMAARYYEVLHRIMGDSEYYSMDPFHEGANTRGIDVPSAYEKIAQAMLTAHPDARWVIQFWQWSGAQYHVLDKVEKGKLIILDLFSDAHTHFDAYKGHDAVYCMLPNFGGRTGFFGRFDKVMTDYFAYGAQYPNIKGIGATPEAIESVPVLYDMLFELPWYSEQPDAKEWMADYAHNRYGVVNTKAEEAWEILRTSALRCQTALQGPHEAVLCARPGLTVDRVSSWGGSDIFYDKTQVLKAAYLLLEANLKGENYSYDLTDIARQALTDYGYDLLRSVNAAHVSGDTVTFRIRSEKFLELILDLDRLLATNKDFMLGRWTQLARGIADEVPGTTEADRDWLELDNARTLITTWGPRESSDYGGLRDYSYREWAGMMKDYYYPRWKAFFADMQGTHDWFAMEWAWAHNGQLSYSAEPKESTAKVVRILFNKYFQPLKDGTYLYRGIVNSDVNRSATVVYRGGDYTCPVARITGDEQLLLKVDFNRDGCWSAEEQSEKRKIMVPADAATGPAVALLTLSDGTICSYPLLIKDKVKKPRLVKAVSAALEQGAVQVGEGTSASLYGTEDVVVKALPRTGYDFSHWTDAKGNTVSYQAEWTYYAKDDVELTAHFLVNKWGAPTEDLSDLEDIKNYKQYVAQLTASQSGKAQVLLTADACPECLYQTVAKRVTAAVGSAVKLDWKDAGGLAYTCLSVYADFNQDGQFDGKTERIAFCGQREAASAAASQGPVQIVLPYDMPKGITHVRLRFDGAWKTGYDEEIQAFPASLPLNRMCYDIVLDVKDYAPYACKVGVKSADLAQGTVDANGQPDVYTYQVGEPVILRAYPAEGYRLAYWQDAYGRKVPTQWMEGHNLKFQARENGEFTAVFEKQ